MPKIRNKWGRLSEDEVGDIGGSRELLTLMLQLRYGYTYAEAQAQIDEFIDNFLEGIEAESDTSFMR